jgi:GcrA cell cycle regulator
VPHAWTPADDARLTALHAAGSSYAEIARALGFTTKNGVVGRAHRLLLSLRPSPIKGTIGTGRIPRRLPKGEPLVEPLVAEPLVAEPIPAPAAIPPEPYCGVCMFPTSDSRPWTWCGQPALPGRPYCPDHCTISRRQIAERAT